MTKPNWIIHYVQEHDCDICGKHEDPQGQLGFYMFANIHTHGFKENGHDEICIVLDIGMKIACRILNDIGLRIRDNHETFQEGIDSSILHGMDVKFYRPKNSSTLYLLLPDKNKKLPGKIGCENPYDKQIFYANIIEHEN